MNFLNNYRNKENLIMLILLLFVSLISICAMANGIVTRSLLHDESLFARNVAIFPDALFFTGAPSPILYYVINYGLVQILGNAEWVFRLIPLIGTIVGYLMLIIFIRKEFDLLTTLISSLFLSASYPLIHYAGNAHPYATDFMLSVLLLIATMRVLRYSEKRAWLNWLILAIFSISFSFSAFLVVAAQGFVILINFLISFKGKKAVFRAAGFLPLAIVAAGLFFVFYRRQAGSMAPHFLGTSLLPDTYHPFVLGKWILGNTLNMFKYLFSFHWSGHVGLFITLLGIGVLVKEKNWRLLAACLGPWVVCLGVSLLQRWPYGYIRTIFFLLPFLVVFIGAAFAGLKKYFSGLTEKVILIFTFCSIIATGLWTWKCCFVDIDHVEDVRSLSNMVESYIDDDDHFLVYYAANTQFQYYFPDNLDKAIVMAWEGANEEKVQRTFIRDNLPQSGQRFWLVFSHYLPEEVTVMISEAQKWASQLKEFKAAGCKAYLFIKDEDR